MSRKLGTGRTRTFSVCLAEEMYAELKTAARSLKVGEYVRRLVDAALADERDGVDTKAALQEKNWTVRP
jgi:hypothetical protein